MNVFVAITVFGLSYLLIVFFIYLSSKKLYDKQHNTNYASHRFAKSYVWIFVILSLIFLLYVGAHYVESAVNPVNYFETLFFLFIVLALTYLLWLSKSPNWLIKNKYKNKTIPLSPINSFGSVLKWFSVLILLFLARVGLLLLIMGRQPPSGGIEVLLPKILETVFYAPIFEETFFRWGFYLVLGEIGVGIGTILWFISHPFQLWLWGVAPWQIVLTSLIWLLPLCYVYVRLWKGKYFWTTYIMHTVSNLLVVFFQGILGIPS